MHTTIMRVLKDTLQLLLNLQEQFLLNAHSKCNKYVTFDLWPFAVRYAIDTWNDTPHKDLNWKTSNSIFAGVKLSFTSINNNLKTYYNFVFPVYVLHENLQDGKIIHK